jgi:hypothetical protein
MDVTDPNDLGPGLSVTLKESFVDEIYALPAAQAEQTSGPYPSTADQSKAPQLPPKAIAEAGGIPAPPDLLDPALLRTMPAKVAAFTMYEPPERPPCEPRLRLSGSTGRRSRIADRGLGSETTPVVAVFQIRPDY